MGVVNLEDEGADTGIYMYICSVLTQGYIAHLTCMYNCIIILYMYVYMHKYAIFLGMQVCCGTAGVKGKYVFVDLPSEAALKQYQLINSCPPGDVGKVTLKLPSIFYTPEELARSNCTKAEP